MTTRSKCRAIVHAYCRGWPPAVCLSIDWGSADAKIDASAPVDGRPAYLIQALASPAGNWGYAALYRFVEGAAGAAGEGAVGEAGVAGRLVDEPTVVLDELLLAV